MMFTIGRILGFLAIIIAAILPRTTVHPLSSVDVQLIAATLVVGTIMFFDAWTGLLFGIALLIVYFNMYFKILTGDDNKYYGPMQNLVTQYITPEHLESAQNNVIDEDSDRSPFIGVKGVYGEAVYDAQGQGNGGLPGIRTSSLGNPLQRMEDSL